MFASQDRRPYNTFRELSRTETLWVYGTSPWTWFIVVLVFVFIISPLWAFPSWESDFRYFAGSVIVVLLGVVWLVGRHFGPRLHLDLRSHRVTWSELGVFGKRVRWSYGPGEIEAVSYWVDWQGVGRVQVKPVKGDVLLVDWGLDEGLLRDLAQDLAICWEIPLKTAPEKM